MSDQHDHDQRPPVPAWAVERLLEQAAEIGRLRTMNGEPFRHQLEAAEQARIEAERRAEEILATYNEARAGYTIELSSQLEELATVTSELAEANAARQKLERQAEEILTRHNAERQSYIANKQALERRIGGALRYLRNPSFEGAIRHAIHILEGSAPPDEDILPPPQGGAL